MSGLLGRIRDEDAELVLQSGLLDPEWVGAQLGRTFETPEDAARAYLAEPACSPHPLFVAEWIEPKFGRPEPGQDPLLWYLRDTRVRRWASTHPLLDVARIRELDDAYDEHPLGPVVAWLESADPDTALPTTTGNPSMTLGELMEFSREALREVLQRQSRGPRGPEPAEAADESATLVSIVMPVRDHATVVREAVESVQGQTHRAWELIVVDDGSTDDTAAVVAGLASFDPRIRWLTPADGGPGARNAALEAATAAYVAFLHPGRGWPPGFLREMLGRLQRHDWDLAHAVSPDRGRCAQTHQDLLDGLPFDLDAVVARTASVQAAGGFDEDLAGAQDYDLLLRLTRAGDLHPVPCAGVAGAGDVAEDMAAWRSVVASRHLVDWQRVSGRDRHPATTSVVLPARSSLRATLRWVNQVAGWPGAELVVVGADPPRWQHVALSVVARAAGNARLVTLGAAHGTATSLNAGAAEAAGEVVVLVLGQVEPDQTAVRALVRAFEDPGTAVAQAVDLDRRGTVASAGAVFGTSNARPEPFLHEHSPDDVRRAGTRTIPAALGSLVAVRGDALARLGGLDPLFGDRLSATEFSLRAQAGGLGQTVLRADSLVVTDTPALPPDVDLDPVLRALDTRHPAPPPGSEEAWAAAGFEVVGRRLVVVGDPDPGPLDTPMLRLRTVLRPRPIERVDEARPSLRWAIDLASPAGPGGQAWGDTHFGAGLADALRRLGQHVCVDPREARHRPTRSYDDVVLVLRGLDRVTPRPECLNVLWVISHPDLVRADEVAPFDLAYAASTSWSADVSEAWGVEVRPLLQATDPALFHPGRAEPDSGDAVLFVGNSRGVPRSSVRAAMGAGAQVAVHGQGWKELLPAGTVVSRGIDNAELGARYAAAGVVLNDHWEDMRHRGFVSNRLMDAAASGARVVSDTVPGVDLTAMFHGLVRTFEDEADMARILAIRDELFPAAAERAEAARKVAAEHSFDARAAVLLDDVLRVRRAGP